jgi:hypothetical protein
MWTITTCKKSSPTVSYKFPDMKSFHVSKLLMEEKEKVAQQANILPKQFHTFG